MILTGATARNSLIPLLCLRHSYQPKPFEQASFGQGPGGQPQFLVAADRHVTWQTDFETGSLKALREMGWV